MAWTKFWDMHSGGREKTSYSKVYVEAPYDEAVQFFESWFGRDPHNVTCQCCGPDFSVDESPSLRQATAYHRNCKFVKDDSERGGGHYVEEPKESSLRGHDYERVPLDDYVGRDDIAVFDRETVENEIGVPVEA